MVSWARPMVTHLVHAGGWSRKPATPSGRRIGWPGAVDAAGVRTNLSQTRMLIACTHDAELVLGRLLRLLGLCWVAVMVGRGQSFWASVLTGQVSWVRVQVGAVPSSCWAGASTTKQLVHVPGTARVNLGLLGRPRTGERSGQMYSPLVSHNQPMLPIRKEGRNVRLRTSFSAAIA
jgi:hypothetical protein